MDFLKLPITDPVAVFALLAVILFITPLLSKKLRIPALVGLILTGAVIGPRGCNFLDFDSGMKLLSTLGLLYIMVIAGLEIDLRQFFNQKIKALSFGILIFGIAMAGGIVAGLVIPRPEGVNPINFCILMGALMSSQTLLTYPIVSRLGLSKNISVTVSIGATLLTDILALIVLAVVAKIHTGEAQSLYWIRLVCGFACLAIISIYLLPRAGRWFYRNLSNDDTAEYLFLFFSLLAVSSIAKMAGLEPIVGAFLAGLSLNSLVPEQSRLMNRVRFVGNTLFIPIFLISVGMLVDYRIFLSGTGEWVAITLMITVAVGAKFAAAQIAGFLFKFSKEQRWLMFGMVVNKAGVTLATAIVGYNIGVFGQDVLNGAIVIIFVTCLIGPWVTENYGRQFALKLSNAPEAKRHFHANQRILVPLSNPTTAEYLMNIAFMIRDKSFAQPIYPLSVAIDGPGVKEDISKIEKMLGQSVVHAAAADIPVRPETRVDTDIASCIARTALEIQASCIIIGWNGDIAPFPRLIFGQVLDRLLEMTSEFMLVCKIEQPVNTFGKIILVIPPMSHRVQGFEESLSTIRTFAVQSGLKTVIIVSAYDRRKTSDIFESGKSSSFVSVTTLDAWSDVFSQIQQSMKPNDMAILFSCRQRSMIWQPAFDQLPRHFIKNYPKNSLIVAYPSEVQADKETASSSDFISQPVRKFLSPDRILFGIENETQEKAVEGILLNFFKDKTGDPASAAALISSELLLTALELTEGAVLLHAHCGDITESTILLGTSAGGISFTEIDKPVHAVFMLLSPSHDSQEMHLKALSGIARFVLSMKDASRIGKVKNLSELEEETSRNPA